MTDTRPLTSMDIVLRIEKKVERALLWYRVALVAFSGLAGGIVGGVLAAKLW